MTTAAGGESPVISSSAPSGVSERRYAAASVRRAIGWIAEVERRDGAIGDDVRCDACLELRDRDDLVERQPAHDRLAPLQCGNWRQALDRLVDRVLRRPGPRRVAADPGECDTCVQVAEAARLDRQIGRLEQDRQISGRGELRALEQIGEWAELGRQLLLAEEQQRHVVGAGRGDCEVANDLECDRDAALHVGRAAPVHRAVGDSPWNVVLRGDRVVVADEQNERHVRPPCPREHERVLGRILGRERLRNEREQVCAHLCLLQALGGDVDQLERPLGQTLRQRFHRASVPAYSRHHPPIRHPGRARAREGAPAGRAPERGRHRGRAGRASRAGADGARRAGGGADPAARAGRPEDLHRQGQARGAEEALRRQRRGCAHRRRRTRPDAAARARRRPLDPRRRPHPADPRHLRPARGERRGKAPGRARAARVQPAPHARHVEAPRAPRWRRWHERPRRVPARERPPDGAAPDHAAARAVEGPAGATRCPAEGAQARRGADRRARGLHQRRQVDAAERAHRCRGVGREPVVRDARSRPPAASSTTASATWSPIRSGSFAACRPSSCRGSRRRSRRLSSRT